MGTSESEGPASSSSASKRKRSASGDSSDVIPAKRLHFIAPNRRYDFDFPDSVIFYIAKNPTSAKLYKKLIETCKYFFWKNPILVTYYLTYKNNEMKASFSEYERHVCLKNVPYKFWVSGYCCIVDGVDSSFKKDLVSSFLPRIYRCKLRSLTLRNQKLTTDEFSFLAAKTRRVIFIDLTVVNRDGKEIAFEKLVELIPEVYSLDHTFKDDDKTITAKSVEELLKLPRLQNFSEFRLFNIPEAFDIDEFLFSHIEKSKSIFELVFADDLSVDYQSRLEAIIDGLIEAQIFDYIPPFISYPEMMESVWDDEKLDKLSEVCTTNGFYF
uniref:DUF38 domain-containing protein n=1 Tax=Panagrolaimus sp. PS1159 TaxID=55785 RepID=A0AC35GSU2_9BILA